MGIVFWGTSAGLHRAEGHEGEARLSKDLVPSGAFDPTLAFDASR